VLLKEFFADNRNRCNGFRCAVHFFLPRLCYINGNMQIGHQKLCHLYKGLRQKCNRVILLLQKIQHLKGSRAEGKIYIIGKPCLLQKVIKGIFRRTALTNGVNGSALQVLQLADVGVCSQDIQKPKVADINDLDFLLHILIVIQNCRNIGGNGCNIIIPLV